MKQDIEQLRELAKRAILSLTEEELQEVIAILESENQEARKAQNITA